MKLKLSLALLAFIATHAAAFQAKIAPESQPTANGASAAEQPFNGFHLMALQAQRPGGQCAAASINGCSCPFCTQLRNIGR